MRLASRPLVGIVLAALAVPGCTAVVSGTAVPAPGATATTTSGPTTTAPTVQIRTPRNVAGVDPCTLLRPEDFADVGPFSAAPRPYERIPNSCVLQVGDGTRNDLVVTVAISGDYKKFKTENPRGYENFRGGHSVWTTCGQSDGSMVCAMGFAVAPNRTLLVAGSLFNGNAPQVVGLLLGPADAALERLPLS